MGWVGRKRFESSFDVDTSTLTLDLTEPISINPAFGLARNSEARTEFRAPIGVAKITKSIGAEDRLLIRSWASPAARGSESLMVTPTPLRAKPSPIEVPIKPDPTIFT
jgi:hypothetical protein